MMQTCALLRPSITKRAARDPSRPFKRPSLKKLQAALTLTLAKFLHKQARMIVGQIIVAKSGWIHKADLAQDEIDQLNAIVNAIDFTGWAVLVGEIEPMLESILEDAGYAALLQVGIAVEARPEILNIVNADAKAYAVDRSAEMIGMRRDALGRLVENPDARWAITDSTRDMVRSSVADAIEQGWSNQRLAQELQDANAFSSQRAMVIARTETNKAANQGALSGFRASGVVEGKLWVTAEDDRVSEECQENADAGEIGLDEDFPSGDDSPPVHPNCRCTIIPIVTANAPQTETADAESGDE